MPTIFVLQLIFMIQRKQTIWLLIVTILSFLSLKFSFYTGNILENNVKTYKEVTAQYSFIILVLSIAVAVAALINIFLYKDRKRQLLISIGIFLISVIIFVLYYLQTKQFVDGTYSLTSLIAVANPVFAAMAAWGIYKDEKLVKSLDRLR